ncbi:hypothetical protein ABKN59_011624 [Abortiporus biennis]
MKPFAWRRYTLIVQDLNTAIPWVGSVTIRVQVGAFEGRPHSLASVVQVQRLSLNRPISGAYDAALSFLACRVGMT